jgi:hypothetical protein
MLCIYRVVLYKNYLRQNSRKTRETSLQFPFAMIPAFVLKYGTAGAGMRYMYNNNTAIHKKFIGKLIKLHISETNVSSYFIEKHAILVP